MPHQFERIADGYACSVCLRRWRGKSKTQCWGLPDYKFLDSEQCKGLEKELFFRQVVGRLIRRAHQIDNTPLEDQSVYLYIPRHALLVKYAQEIAVQRKHAITVIKAQRSQKEFDEDKPEFIPLDAIAQLGTTLTPYGEFTDEELAQARRLKLIGNLPVSVEIIASILQTQRRLRSSA